MSHGSHDHDQPDEAGSRPFEKALEGLRPAPIAPEVFEKLAGSIPKFPKISMPAFDELQASARALRSLSSDSSILTPRAEAYEGLKIPAGATHDDVAGVTEAVVALHNAVLEQSRFQVEQSKRQDRMDRRFFWLEVAVGAIGVSLAIATIVITIVAS